ncbi:MAG: peptidoglycan DD-metalloendopeptidase family protein [Clostridia bacterium]|nr:peptidoglycan DD-metalloendopeptidase family protein [Clostridia bacterium]
MTKRRKIFRLAAAFLAVCCLIASVCFSAPQVSADEELEDLQKQYEELEKEIEKNQSELNEVQGDIKDNKSKLKTLNNEIDSINSQISILNSRIDALNNDISEIEGKIASTNDEISEMNDNIALVEKQIDETHNYMEDTKNMLLGRIRENYMAGESSTVEMLFTSDDLSTYFAREELMMRVSENDAALIEELSKKIDELNQLEDKLDAQKVKLEEKKASLESEKADLDARKVDLKDSKSTEQSKKKQVTGKQQEVQEIINDLDKDSDEYKAAIKKAQAEKEILSRQIDEYIREHGSTVGDTPDSSYGNDGKMAWPVKFESYITAGYPSYSDGSPHWGIDICAVGGNTRGRPFNAAQGGEVIIAVNDSNWNYGFGNYCVIDHGDGTQTLYAHSDNIKVSVGQVVQKGQEIGIIGATGNVTGPHLHFEVRVKNADGSVSRVQPLNYVSNPYN